MESFLQIFTLGKLEILLNGQTLPEFPTRKVEALLIYLAYTAKAQSREHLADLLWDERSHSQALSNLRTSLSRLNQQVSEFLLVTRQDVAIHPDAHIWMDATEFLKMDFSFGANNHLRAHHSAEELEAMLALYGGDFLENVYLRDSLGFENWLGEQRRVLAKKLSYCLLYLVNHYLECGDYARGIKHAQRLLQLEPTNEAAYRYYMQLLAQTGQRSVALAEYEKACQILREELQTEPEDLTRALYESILAGHISSSIRPRLDMLPIQVTQFLGRDAELTQIRQHLANPACRLLSILGLGGIGKTRLAYQIAEEQHQSFQHGICFLALAEIKHPELLIPKLAEALRFNLRNSSEPMQQLLNHLRDKELLIILDNCEHLLEGLVFLSDILKATERVKIVTTSRERLNLQGEWLFPIEGLEYPRQATETHLENYAATALFIQTAQRLDASFIPDDSAALIQICHLVGGMPLAIELAATWIRQLSPQQIVRELEKNNELLNSNLRDIPARHRNIDFIFEESWRMLSQSEQKALMQLAVFHGSINPEAAEAVTQINIVQLANLAEKSLLQLDKRGIYRLHERLRRFILDKLEEAGKYEVTAKRHAEYFCENLRLAYQHSHKWRTTNEQIHENYGNYAAALHFAYQAETIELFALLMSRLTYYWESSFKISEALFWVRRALNQLNTETPDYPKMQILICAGIFFRLEPNISLAKQYLEQGIELARKLKSAKDLVDALHTFGHIHLVQGDYAALEAIYKEHLFLARYLEDEYRIGRAYYNLANLALDNGQLATAKDYASKTLEIYRSLNLADSAILCNLGLISYLEANFAHAEAYFQESIVQARLHNEIYNVVANLINLGDVAAEHHKLEQAKGNYLEAFETAILSSNSSGQLSSLESLAVVLAEQSQSVFATWLFSAVTSQRQMLSLPSASFNHARNQATLEKLQAALGEDSYEFYWTKGKVVDFELVRQAVFKQAWLSPEEAYWYQ